MEERIGKVEVAINEINTTMKLGFTFCAVLSGFIYYIYQGDQKNFELMISESKTASATISSVGSKQGIIDVVLTSHVGRAEHHVDSRPSIDLVNQRLDSMHEKFSDAEQDMEDVKADIKELRQNSSEILSKMSQLINNEYR